MTESGKPHSPSIVTSDPEKVEETIIERVHNDVRSEDYEHHYEDHGQASVLTAYFNVVCVVAGTGTLGLPKAFAEGGWLGIMILLLSYAMAVYSGVVLIRCLYYKQGQRLHDIKAVGTAAFGTCGYLIASVLHFFNLFGCPALYLVLAGGNMHQLLSSTSAGLTQAEWTIIVGAFLLIPSLLQKTLREVTLTSAVGAICTMMAVMVVLIQAPMEAKKNAGTVAHDGVIWTGFPTALSTIAFSFGGNNTYPHVEHALKKPRQWKWALLAGLSTCTVLYFLTAVPGYYAYGRDTQSPIYNSLADGPGKMVAIVVMTVHVILAIPIFTTSFSIEFERFVHATDNNIGRVGAWFARAAIRTVTMVILVVLAVFVPYFADFMSLMGALANCGLVFLIPIACYLRLTGWRNKPIYELAFCALTILMGFVGCIFGTIDAIKALVHDFQTQGH